MSKKKVSGTPSLDYSRPASLKNTFSAALLASAFMAGTGSGQYIDTPTTISGTVDIEYLFIENGNLVDGNPGTTPTINASEAFYLIDGEIRDVDLIGTGDLVKLGSSTVKVSSGSAGNSWTGGTFIFEGTLKATSDNALSHLSDTFVDTGTVLDMTDTYQEVASLQDYFEYGSGAGTIKLGDLGHLQIGRSGNSGSFAGTFEGGTSAIIEKSGDGIQTLTGDSTNFQGAIRVEQGALILGNGVTGSFEGFSSLTIDSSDFVLNMADGAIFRPETTTGVGVQFAGSGGALWVTSSGTTTIDVRGNEMKGSGTLNQAGSGRTIVLGYLDHTRTNVSSGILQIGDGIDTESRLRHHVTVSEGALLDIRTVGKAIIGTVENDGVILFAGSGIQNIGAINAGGRIRGNGSLIIDGDANQELRLNNSDNSYSGDTLILSGTLTAANNWALSENSAHYVALGAELNIKGKNQEIASLSGSGYVDMTDADLYLAGDSFSIFDGVLDSSGSASSRYLTKNGTGTWVFDGDAYNVIATVNNGLMVIGLQGGNNGAYWGGDVDIFSNGIVAGRGFIDGDLYNEGVLIPGTETPGTLAIREDYDQLSTGALLVRIDSKNSFSSLLIGGDAYIDGQLIVARTGKKARPGSKFTVVETLGSVYGTYNVVDAAESMVGSKVSYESDAVIVEFYQKKFGSLSGLTPNQKETAKALDRIAGKKKAQNLIDKLNFESLDDVRKDIAVLAPEARAIMFNIGFATSRIQTGNIERRLDDVRNGSYGFSANGLALSNSRGTLNYSGLPITHDSEGLSLAGWDGGTVVEKRFVAPAIDINNRWGFFATGTGEWADVETTRNARGAEFTTGGVTVGADYRVSDNVVVGLSANYANTSSDFWNGGSLDVNSGRAAMYGSIFCDGLYGNALVGGGYNAYKTRYNTIGGTSRGSTNGGEFDAYLGGGYDFRTESGITVGPIASLQYTYIGLNGYTESGSDAPMTFPSQSQNSLRSTLGARASYAFGYGTTVIRPEVRAQWAHEFLDSTASIEAGFAAGGGTFSNTGTNIGRNSLVIDAGVVVDFSPAYSVFAYYTGDLARENYSSHGVNGGFRVSF